jgi:hypothetical protein
MLAHPLRATVLVGNEGQRMADQVNNAGLDESLRKGGGDGFWCA